MEVLEYHSSGDELGPLFDCADGSFNFINMLFGGRGVHNGIFHQLIYSLVGIYVHKDSFYYHTNSGIYFHNPFLKIYSTA